MQAIKSLLLAAALAATTVTAGAGVTITNSCSYNIYVNGNKSPIKPGQVKPLSMTGTDQVYKIGPTTNVYDDNIAQVEYSVVGETVNYDLSLLNGNPFKEHGTALYPSVGTCTPVYCAPGVDECPHAYFPGSDPADGTKTCGTGMSLSFIACSS